MSQHIIIPEIDAILSIMERKATRAAGSGNPLKNVKVSALNDVKQRIIQLCAGLA
jgi:hypothetical protein